MNSDACLTRAQLCDNIPCAYVMGAGTNKASTSTPFEGKTIDGHWYANCSDCSNFSCWCLGVDKHDGGQWWGTDQIVQDALGPSKRWKLLPAPVLGCMVVYAGHMVDGHRQAGHCGIVCDIGQKLTYDCGSSSFKHGGDAVTKRHLPGFWFRPAALPQPIFVVPNTWE